MLKLIPVPQQPAQYPSLNLFLGRKHGIYAGRSVYATLVEVQPVWAAAILGRVTCTLHTASAQARDGRLGPPSRGDGITTPALPAILGAAELISLRDAVV